MIGSGTPENGRGSEIDNRGNGDRFPTAAIGSTTGTTIGRTSTTTGTTVTGTDTGQTVPGTGTSIPGPLGASPQPRLASLWAAGSLFYDTGYYGYANPYYEPAAVQYPAIDYSQPIVTTTALPDADRPRRRLRLQTATKGTMHFTARLRTSPAARSTTHSPKRRATLCCTNFGPDFVLHEKIQGGGRYSVCGSLGGPGMGLDDDDRALSRCQSLHGAAALPGVYVETTRTHPTRISCSPIST